MLHIRFIVIRVYNKIAVEIYADKPTTVPTQNGL